MAEIASADTFHWDDSCAGNLWTTICGGGTDSNWNQGGQLPGLGDEVIISSGGVSLLNLADVGPLRVDETASLHVSGDLSVESPSLVHNLSMSSQGTFEWSGSAQVSSGAMTHTAGRIYKVIHLLRHHL